MSEQQNLETQKRIIDTLSQHSHEAVIITDTNRLVTHFNKAAEELTKYNVVNVLGRSIDEFLSIFNDTGEISMDQCCPLGEIDQNGIVYSEDNLKLITQSKEEKVVNVQSMKVKGGTELGLGCLIFIEDTFYKSELERMKLDFVSMAEHILKTPITIVRGYLSRLLEDKTLGKLDESEINYLNNSFASTNNLLDLIENLLNLSEIQKSGYKLNLVKVDMESLVLKIVNEFKVVASEKGLRISFIPPLYKLPTVDIDVLKIGLALQNLIDNAIKYTEKGNVEVILSKKGSSDEESTEPVTIVVSIKDTGKGIPDENQKYLFSKFYRVKSALHMELGLGLGLYMCKAFVEAHGGKIWVESKEGVGSTFSFSLPVTNDE